MNSPEVGFTPEPEISEEEAEVVEPAKRRGLWNAIFHREKSEEVEEVSEAEKALEIEEAIVDMEAMTAQEWRDKKIQEKYGEGRIGWLKSFAAGERNFSIDEDGEIRRNGWMELGQKALTTVFNRKTVVAASTLAVVGIFTGGVGLPAAGALFGTMAGRGVVEAWESVKGKDRGMREAIAKEEFKQFRSLQEKASAIDDIDLPDEERNNGVGEFIDSYFSINENVENVRKDIIEEQKVWNKRRQIGEFIGGVAGLGAGIWAGFQGLAEKAMTMDIDGNKIAHAVEKVNGAWHYVYNTQAEVMNAIGHGATVSADASGYAVHALGEASKEVVMHAAQNLTGEALQVGAVVAGLFIGNISEKRKDKNALKNHENEVKEREETYKDNRDYFGGGGGVSEAFDEVAVSPEEQHWQEQFRGNEKQVPVINEVWMLPGDVNMRIEKIDYNSGNATVTLLTKDLQILKVDGKQTEHVGFNLKDLAGLGKRKDLFHL